jgi:hypothetical protein
MKNANIIALTLPTLDLLWTALRARIGTSWRLNCMAVISPKLISDSLNTPSTKGLSRGVAKYIW